MDGGEELKKNNNKLLFIVFGVLCAVAIALAIIVIVMKVGGNEAQNETGNEDNTGTEFVLPEELQRDDLSFADQVTKEVTLMINNPKKNNSDDILAYFDKSIKEALDNGDSDSAAKVVVKKVSYIVVTKKNCDAAISYTNEFDFAPYSRQQRGFIASHVISLMNECSDKELNAEWNEYNKEIKNESE